MKTLTIPAMQKAQKLAIKLGLIVLISSINYSHAQINDDAYYLLDKIIQLVKQPNDSIYELSSRNEIGKGFFRKYYNFRFNDKPFHTTITYDSIADIIGYDTLKLEQNRIKWKAKYRILDSVFTKEDIEQIMELKVKDTKWDSANVIFNSKTNSLIRWCNGDYCKNFISIPYYNEKRNHLFVATSHYKNGRSTTMYIFKKDEEDWLLIDKIENVGW
jgi:hypothetical protein